MKFLTIIVLASLTVSIMANAAGSRDISADMLNHLTPLNAEVHDVTEKYQKLNRFNFSKNKTSKSQISASTKLDPLVKLNETIGTLTAVEVIVDKVVNIGTKVWSVLEKGKPVASYHQQTANAVPQNITSWQQLEGWTNPQSKYYEIEYKNLYGITVAKLVYKIIYLTGGSYNGLGKYIGYVAVEPQEFSTAYMYTFNVQASVESVYNKNTTANPIAGMILNINWTLSTIIKTETQSYSYHIDGLGNFQAL